MIIKILLFLPGVVLGCKICQWLLVFVYNAHKYNDGCIKLPFSTVRFLLLKNSDRPAEVEYDKTYIRIKLYKETKFRNFTAWDRVKTLYVELSFIDWLKYRRFYKQLEKEKENRQEYENLQRVRDIIKEEQEKLEKAAERERKKALDTLKSIPRDDPDGVFKTAQMLIGMKKPASLSCEGIKKALQQGGVYSDKTALQIAHLAHLIENGAITPDEARIILDLEVLK